MIGQLVKELPEIYQPIFGYPELSKNSSRTCVDRLAKIKEVYFAIEKLIGRPLRVLDLGCSQGFFSLHLAEIGATVCGVDCVEKNIALCNALANKNPSLSVKFVTCRIEDFVDNIRAEDYDIVLGLSVFHHLAHEHGIPLVKQMLKKIAQCSGALILEMALNSEPLYWSVSQPRNPRELIESIGFIHLLAHHGTHLANIPRPLYVASEYYWILDGRAEKFNQWVFESHNLSNGVHQNSRRYFFSDRSFLKQYLLDHARGDINLNEYLSEINFYETRVPGFNCPNLLTSGRNEAEAWICSEKINGQLLLDRVRNNVAYDDRQILKDILNQLILLENFGFYHDDVRLWNVVIASDSEKLMIIDYGAISKKPFDCAWPYNIFLSFFIFVHELVTRQCGNPIPLRAFAISPFGLPEPYRLWINCFWSKPVEEWSFKLLYKTLNEIQLTEDKPHSEMHAISLWMGAIEQAMQVQKMHVSNLFDKANSEAHQAQERTQLVEAKAQQVEVDLHITKEKLHTEMHAISLWMGAIEQTMQVQKMYVSNLFDKANAGAQQAQEQAQLAEDKAKQVEVDLNIFNERLNAVYNSASWRLTIPLRWTMQRLRLYCGHEFIKRVNAAVKKYLPF